MGRGRGGHRRAIGGRGGRRLVGNSHCVSLNAHVCGGGPVGYAHLLNGTLSRRYSRVSRVRRRSGPDRRAGWRRRRWPGRPSPRSRPVVGGGDPGVARSWPGRARPGRPAPPAPGCRAALAPAASALTTLPQGLLVEAALPGDDQPGGRDIGGQPGVLGDHRPPDSVVRRVPAAPHRSRPPPRPRPARRPGGRPPRPVRPPSPSSAPRAAARSPGRRPLRAEHPRRPAGPEQRMLDVGGGDQFDPGQAAPGLLQPAERLDQPAPAVGAGAAAQAHHYGAGPVPQSGVDELAHPCCARRARSPPSAARPAAPGRRPARIRYTRSTSAGRAPTRRRPLRPAGRTPGCAAGRRAGRPAHRRSPDPVGLRGQAELVAGTCPLPADRDGLGGLDGGQAVAETVGCD